MKASGTPTPPQNDLDKSEGQSDSLHSLQAGVEDLLAELARLVDTPDSLFARSLLPPGGRTGTEPSQPSENAALEPSIDVISKEMRETAAVALQAPPVFKFGNAYLSVKASALALAVGAVLIGAGFGLKHGVLGPPKAPSFVAAADGSSEGLLPNDQTLAISSDAGMIPRNDIPQPVEVMEITPDRHPIELEALGKVSSAGALSAAAINVAPLFSAAAPATPQFASSEALPTLSLGQRGRQITMASPAAEDAGETLQASNPAGSVRKGAGAATGPGQLSKNKPGLTTKLSAKPPAPLVVAKTETAAMELEAEKAPPAVPEPDAAPQSPPPAPQPVSPLYNAFGYIVGALKAPAGPFPQSAVGPPIELGDRDSLGSAPPLASLAPTSAQSTTGPPSRPSVGVPVITPVAAPRSSALSSAAPQFPNSNPKPSVPVVVARTETASPGSAAEKNLGALSAMQHPVDPLSHAFSHVVGAVRAPAAFAPQSVDQIAAQNSSDWALQFATQKSEAEAKANAVRLNAKYAAALNGAKIGVNKILVDGQISYAPRVSGLSKSEVAALCERLKGRDCFIAK